MIYLCILLLALVAVAVVFFCVKTQRIQADLRQVQGQYAAMQETLDKMCGRAQSLYRETGERMDLLTDCITDLRNGIVPDYEKAKAAAKAMDDFNTGLAGIMGYDPMKAIKRERSGGGEIE